MKKFLSIAVVAVALMACEGNNADVPKQEEAALKAATVQMVSQIGVASPAQVDQVLTKAGFVKAKELGAIAKVKARTKAKLPQAVKEESSNEEVYVYGLPENYQNMSEDELNAWLKNELEKGKGSVSVAVSFNNDVLCMSSTAWISAIREKANLTYTTESDALYSSLPAPFMENASYWQGEAMLNNEEKSFTSHAEYVAAIAAAEAVDAQEQGFSITAMDMESDSAEGRVYVTMWSNPTEEVKQEMLESEGVAYIFGAFVIADIATYLQ